MPKPRQGESEHRFIDRCMKDPEAISDFPDAGQRMAFCYSQFERKSKGILTKAAKDGWGVAFEDELRKSERGIVPSVRRFYEAEYQKGIDAFITSGLVNPNTIFQTNGFREIYQEIYQGVGMRFAKWYAKNFDKYIEKGVNPKQFESRWQNLSLVQGTAKQTLVKILRANMADPEFSALGADAKQRVLRKQTKRYSKNQALRLVRTESTNAANYATMQSALSIFPAQQMMKEWVSSFDDRTRDDHAAASGQQVKFEEPFIVGGDRMMHPADSSMGASSANIVNCRCSSFPFPMENAQATQVFESIGFALAGEAIASSLE
jgi:uncharacterized protein with gpF-like domain